MDNQTFKKIKKEEFRKKFVSTKPFDFVNTMKGRPVIIETKAGEIIKCTIISYDENMNLRIKTEKGEVTLPGSRLQFIYENKNQQ